jgi:hypothetical protein
MVTMLAVGALGPVGARAADGDVTPDMLHSALAIGYHNITAPIGGRFWFPGQMVGIDLGFGYRADETTLQDGRGFVATSYVIGLGAPITIRRWNRLRFVGRPGIGIEIDDQEIPVFDEIGDIVRSDVAKLTTFTLGGEVEVEYYLLDRLSASAGYGAQIARAKLGYPGATARRSSQSTGGDLFQLGFHLYLWNGH